MPRNPVAPERDDELLGGGLGGPAGLGIRLLGGLEVSLDPIGGLVGFPGLFGGACSCGRSGNTRLGQTAAGQQGREQQDGGAADLHQALLRFIHTR